MRLLLPWMDHLPLQQQAVLVLACRGFDGTGKHTPSKPLVRTVRAHCLTAAKFGRAWAMKDDYSDFMTLNYIDGQSLWDHTCNQFLESWDTYNVHALMHLVHAAEVLGYKLPDPRHRQRWLKLYRYICHECLHVNPESKEDMDSRLNDWGMVHWEPSNAELTET